MTGILTTVFNSCSTQILFLSCKNDARIHVLRKSLWSYQVFWTVLTKPCWFRQSKSVSIPNLNWMFSCVPSYDLTSKDLSILLFSTWSKVSHNVKNQADQHLAVLRNHSFLCQTVKQNEGKKFPFGNFVPSGQWDFFSPRLSLKGSKGEIRSVRLFRLRL